MNSRLLLLGLGILVLVAGGIFLVNQQKPSTTQTQEQTEVSPSPTSTSTSSQAEEVMVTITAAGFEPKTVTVRADTKAIWTNKSGGISNVSSAIHPTHLIYPPLNLGDIVSGASVSLVFDKAGTYKYHNHLNATQTGTVVVE